MSHNNEQCRKICPRGQKWQECYGVEQRFLIECKTHSMKTKKIHAWNCKSGPHVCGLGGLSAKILLMNTVSNCHLNSYLYTFRLTQLSDLTIHASLCKDNSQSKSSQLVRVQTVSLEYSAVTMTITPTSPKNAGYKEDTQRKTVSF